MNLEPKDQSVEEIGNGHLLLEPFVFIREEQVLSKVAIDDIFFVKSDANYIEIHLAEKKYIVRSKLSDFALQVCSHAFFKVHQRYLVNLTKVSSISRSFVLVGGHEIPISKSHYSALTSSIFTFP